MLKVKQLDVCTSDSFFFFTKSVGAKGVRKDGSIPTTSFSHLFKLQLLSARQLSANCCTVMSCSLLSLFLHPLPPSLPSHLHTSLPSSVVLQPTALFIYNRFSPISTFHISLPNSITLITFLLIVIYYHLMALASYLDI